MSVTTDKLRSAGMATGERPFEDFSVEELSMWLAEKGFSAEVQEAFEGWTIDVCFSELFAAIITSK